VALTQIPTLILAELDAGRECRAAVDKEHNDHQPEQDRGEDDQPDGYGAIVIVVFHFFSLFGGDGQPSPLTSTPTCLKTRH
jgi:hypothetical protein